MLPSCDLATWSLCLVFGTLVRPVSLGENIVKVARGVHDLFRIHQNAYCKMARSLFMTTAHSVPDVTFIRSVSNIQ